MSSDLNWKLLDPHPKLWTWIHWNLKMGQRPYAPGAKQSSNLYSMFLQTFFQRQCFLHGKSEPEKQVQEFQTVSGGGRYQKLILINTVNFYQGVTLRLPPSDDFSKKSSFFCAFLLIPRFCFPPCFWSSSSFTHFELRFNYTSMN